MHCAAVHVCAGCDGGGGRERGCQGTKIANFLGLCELTLGTFPVDSTVVGDVSLTMEYNLPQLL